VTPGVTPGGTRDIRTFLDLSTGVVSDCCGAEGAAVRMEDDGMGGGAASSMFVIEAGRVSIA
jgi:hypothetical protein